MVIKNFKLEIHGEIKNNYLYLYLYCGEGNGNPLQYSCLENSMYRGAWPATNSPWDGKELDLTEQLTHTCILFYFYLSHPTAPQGAPRKGEENER